MFITYQDDVIWGTGQTKAASQKEARKWVDDWNADAQVRVLKSDLSTAPCSDEFQKELKRKKYLSRCANHAPGQLLPWVIDDGVAVLESEVDQKESSERILKFFAERQRNGNKVSTTMLSNLTVEDMLKIILLRIG